MFNSDERKVVSLFVTATGESAPQLQVVFISANHKDYAQVLRHTALFEGTPAAAWDYIQQNPHSAQQKNLTSVWIDKLGEIYVMRPHSHTVSAYTAIRENLPAGYITNKDTLPQSLITWRDLTRLSGGIMRAQLYPVGIGCSVEMHHLPNEAQLQSIGECLELTQGTLFVGELYDQGRLIGRVTRFAVLLSLVDQVRGCNHAAEMMLMVSAHAGVEPAEQGASSAGRTIRQN